MRGWLPGVAPAADSARPLGRRLAVGRLLLVLEVVVLEVLVEDVGFLLLQRGVSERLVRAAQVLGGRAGLEVGLVKKLLALVVAAQCAAGAALGGLVVTAGLLCACGLAVALLLALSAASGLPVLRPLTVARHPVLLAVTGRAIGRDPPSGHRVSLCGVCVLHQRQYLRNSIRFGSFRLDFSVW